MFSRFFLLSQIPPAVLTGFHHGVGAFLVDAFLFLNVVTTELWLIQAIHTGPTVSSEAAGALTTGPELVLAGRTFHQRPLGLQLLTGDISKPVLPHQNTGRGLLTEFSSWGFTLPRQFVDVVLQQRVLLHLDLDSPSFL